VAVRLGVVALIHDVVLTIGNSEPGTDSDLAIIAAL
jgi:hypothetical protein